MKKTRRIDPEDFGFEGYESANPVVLPVKLAQILAKIGERSVLVIRGVDLSKRYASPSASNKYFIFYKR